MTADRTISSVNGRRRALVLATLAFVLLLGTMAAAIVFSHSQGRQRLLASFHERASTSSQFLSTYLSQQAGREIQTAQRFLAGRHVSTSTFESIVDTFGSDAAVLLDRNGRLLDAVPQSASPIGSQIAARYAQLRAAGAGHVVVSGVVASASKGLPVVAIAVPFSTASGQRVFSPAYRLAGSVLNSFVDQTIAYPQHQVLLIDGQNNVIAASPRSTASTLAGAAPTLAKNLSGGSNGSFSEAGLPMTFTMARVAGTNWRLVIAVPNYKLFASIGGVGLWIPWIVFVLVAVLAVVMLILFWRFMGDRARLGELSQQMTLLAQTDALTGLANRRLLTERLNQTLSLARRNGQPISLLMIDLDHFKQINDSFGHHVGDEVLRAVAECMREVFRQSDIFGRWGGDEFLAALPNTDEMGALRAATRLRKRVAELTLAAMDGHEGVSLSVGCATGSETTVADLMSQADGSLYEAKRAGRNQVIRA